MSPTRPSLPTPLVSVLTAAYNAESFILETINSVRAQDYPAWEHVIVDDGSTDRTGARIDPYRSDPRVRLFVQTNRGEAAALNRAAAEAKGEYLLVLSADDLIRPGLLAAAVTALEADASLGAVYPDWEVIDARSRVISTVRPREFDLDAMVVQHMCLPGPGTVIRRSAIAGETFRDPAFSYKSDFDLWLRIASRHPIRHLPGIYAAWRSHAAGATSARRGCRMAAESVEVITRFLQSPHCPQRIAARQTLALSVAYYIAGLNALHSVEVEGKSLMLRSLRMAPIWPSDFYPETRRAWSRILYIFMLPVSRWIHRAGLALRLPLPRG